MSSPDIMREDEKADLVTHLEELRGRLIRTAIYIMLGMAIGWFFYDSFLARFLMAPISRALHGVKGSQMTMRGVIEPFTTKLLISFVAGLVIAGPFVIWEAWSFIAPGLTREERRSVRPYLPMVILLFLCGVVTCYFIMPAAFRWIFSLTPKDVTLLPSFGDYVGFMAKMFLAFGLCFQLPVAIMILAKLGIVSSRGLVRRWREAFVAIAIAAAVVTPSVDAASMIALMVPLLILYWLSIFLARRVEPKEDTEE